MRTVCFSLPKPVNIGFGGRTRAKQTCLFLSSVNLIFVCQKDFIHCISNYPNVYMKSTESGRGGFDPLFFCSQTWIVALWVRLHLTLQPRQTKVLFTFLLCDNPLAYKHSLPPAHISQEYQMSLFGRKPPDEYILQSNVAKHALSRTYRQCKHYQQLAQHFRHPFFSGGGGRWGDRVFLALSFSQIVRMYGSYGENTQTMQEMNSLG